ncbi:ATP-binding cassette domain-containing protein [Dongshaea marina]|uniref:ATP-binding cassette domain-containing protein n=1 Tax=Dongshaea marina TaxID=2047966 RepID=UPI000D3E68EB|nr:ATP-binding cassette domain-containing protein [Dongshaea marina]
MLSVNHLCLDKRLNQLSFELAPGELVCLLGPNGSGKSSLLSSLSGLLTDYRGEITLGAHDLREYSLAELGRVRAMLPQRAQSFLSMPGFQVMELGASLLGVPRSQWLSAAEELIERLELESLVTRDFTQLSGGEQQRLLLARTLLQIWPTLNNQGQLLLLDEPLTGLDLHHQWIVLNLLQELSQQGICVVLSIHDFNLALRFGKRLLMLKRGELVADGAPGILDRALLKKIFGIETAQAEIDGYEVFIPVGM